MISYVYVNHSLRWKARGTSLKRIFREIYDIKCYQLSVISYQLSVISYQLSVISYQLSVGSRQV